VRLALSGAEVHFLLRGDHDAIARDGYSVEMADTGEVLRLQPVHAHRDTASIGPVDIVLVALKTTANDALAQLIPPLLGPDTLCLTVQNGMGSVELLQELHAPDKVVGGLCQIGVERVSAGHLRSFVPGGGFVQLGEPSGAPRERTHALAALFRDAGIRVRIADSLDDAVWRKLMWNVPFNGLCILAGGVTTDHIVDHPQLAELSLALMEELRCAGNALGCAIEPEYGPKLMEFTRNIGAYPPSSLLDWRAGRALEVEAIFGEPLRRGCAAGIPMPRLQTVHALLTGLKGC